MIGFLLLTAALACYSDNIVDTTIGCRDQSLMGPIVWKQTDGLIVNGQRYSSGVGFRVWAPNADANTAYVVPHGSASWSKTQMQKNSTDGTFYANVGGANVGDEYTFEFTYQGGSPFSRLDPRAQGISATLGKAEIDKATKFIYHEGGMISIPPPGVGYAQSWATSIVHDPNFDWTGAPRVVPNMNSLIIYEMHIPSFNPTNGGIGTLDSAISKLSYLQSLGINAVELLPISLYSGDDDGWGYNPCGYFAIMPDIGGYAALKRFVKAANQLGIAVFLDIVFNHMDAGSNILKNYDGYSGSSGNGIYFYEGNLASTPWGPRPNFGNSNVLQYLLDNIQLWLDEYHISGFRWDSTICIRHGGTAGVPCYNDLADIDAGWVLMQKGNDLTHQAGYSGYGVAEDTKEYQAITSATTNMSTGLPGAPGGAGFNDQWGEQYYYTLEPQLVVADNSQVDMNKLASMLLATDGEDPRRVMYTENHDKASNQQNGRIPAIVNPGGSPNAPSFWAFKKSFMGMSFILTAPGVPMLFYGQEFLTYAPFTYPDPPSINWNLASTNAGAVKFVSDMAILRRNLNKTTSGLTGTGVKILDVVSTSTQKTLVMSRYNTYGQDDVVVVYNMYQTDIGSFALNNMPSDGTWNVRLNSDNKKYCSQFNGFGTGQTTVSVSGGKGTLSLPGYAIVILSK